MVSKTGIGIGNGIPFGNNSSGGDRPYLSPELKSRLRIVAHTFGKRNEDADRATIRNLVDPDNPLLIKNAAFKLNSGFGKYEVDFLDYSIVHKVVSITRTSDKLSATNNDKLGQMLLYRKIADSSKPNTPAFKIKISNLTSSIRYYYIDESDTTERSSINITSDGVYDLPESKNTLFNGTTSVNIGFAIDSGGSVTIEQIPSLEDSFISDGVNDIIESTKTFAETFGEDCKEFTIVSMIRLIGTSASSSNSGYTNYFRSGNNYTRNNVTNADKTGIYGYYANLNNQTFTIIDYVLGDKNDYKVNVYTPNGSIANAKFTPIGYIGSDGTLNELRLSAYTFTIGAIGKLTEDDINQIIGYYNLDRTVKADIYCNITKQGITNKNHAEFNDKLIDYSGNGRDIQMYNLAWKGGSGIDDDGALCLDGVNDFGKVTGMPIYKDYTVVADYIRTSAKENAQDSSILSKSKSVNNGAFLFNFLDVSSRLNSYSFGTNNGLASISDSERKIYYQSKYVNDGKSINSGTGTDYDSMWLGTHRDNNSPFFNGAIYSLMSFPYSMSEFLIERQLKKYKLGTLYPNMVEFRPVIKANANYKITYYQIDSTNTWKSIKVGDYIVIGAKLAFQITFDNDASELKEVVSPQLSGIIVEKRPSNTGYNIYSYITSKSPQKINITIDEYIWFEDIVQPYPVIFQITDRNTNQRYSWGDKIKVGSSIRLSHDENPNLLPELYNINSYEYKGERYSYNQLTNLNIILTKQSISLSCNKTWLLDDNEPKSILSPRLLRIPNSSYKILGYIPDISGHGNHGVINNSAYAEGSGVNEDGSYQFDGVDDFVSIPTLSSGGKQVLMKVNWQSTVNTAVIYDQRTSGGFAILNGDTTPDGTSIIAYEGRNIGGCTYIDGVLNKYIYASQLKDITHNITAICSPNNGVGNLNPLIGTSYLNVSYTKMSLYDFMLFDNISTDDKIKELNKYVGIEAKVEKPPYYWDAYGKTNSDEDRSTIQQRGTAVGDYDLTNYNHAYDKMSGYGGYEFAKFDNKEWTARNREDGIKVIERNAYSFTAKRIGAGTYFYDFQNRSTTILDKSLTVKAISNNNTYIRWEYKYRTAEKPDVDSTLLLVIQAMTPNVPITVTLPYKTEQEKADLGVTEGSDSYLFYFDPSNIPVGEEYTVEMLPLYPNGLAYDGVTDYSENINIPMFDDFTFLVKASLLKGFTGSGGCIARKGDKNHHDSGGYAFIYCFDSPIEIYRNSYYSFGKALLLSTGAVDPPLIGYMTKTSVNGVATTFGTNPDVKGINFGDWNGGRMSMVVYKSILYSKTISLLEINFLKNLMNSDGIIDINHPIFISNIEDESNTSQDT